MSLVGARTYFKSKCESLGYIEHKEAFSTENIPNVRGKKHYFIRFGEATQDRLDQSSMDISCPVEVHLYPGSDRESIAIADVAQTHGEALVSACMNTTSRLNQSFKNILFGSLVIEGIGSSNDNAAVAKASFTVKTTLGL